MNIQRLQPAVVVGINAYHGDASVAVIQNGNLVAAMEEERFRRIKHTAGFPTESLRACLALAQIAPNEIDRFAISRDPRAHFWRKVRFAVTEQPRLKLVVDRAKNAGRVHALPGTIAEALKLNP